MNKIKENSVSGVSIRLGVWLMLFAGFIFALAFLITSQFGVSTLDTIMTPLRLLTGVSDPKLYGKAFLMPVGIIMIIVAVLINYKMNKKWRVDYFIALIPILILGFAFDFVLQIPFFEKEFAKNTFDLATQTSVNMPFVSNPISILYSFIGFFMFVFTLGAMSATKIAPNSYVMFVGEIAAVTKKQYKTIQWLSDGIFMLLGFIMLSTAISIGQYDSTTKLTWWNLLKIFGPMTIVIVLTQGYLINKSFLVTEKAFKTLFT